MVHRQAGSRRRKISLHPRLLPHRDRAVAWSQLVHLCNLWVDDMLRSGFLDWGVWILPLDRSDGKSQIERKRSHFTVFLRCVHTTLRVSESYEGYCVRPFVPILVQNVHESVQVRQEHDNLHHGQFRCGDFMGVSGFATENFSLLLVLCQSHVQM